jgi:hypothetical protein
VVGGLALAVPTVLAVRIVDRPLPSAPPVVRHLPAITPQAATAHVSPVAGWPASVRLALRLGLLVGEPTRDRRT